MAVIAVERLAAEAVTRLSNRRAEAIAELRPDMVPAIELQQHLLSIVIEAASTLARGRLPRLSLPPNYLAAKLSRRVPVLASEPIPVPAAPLTSALLRLTAGLAEGGAGDAARHIEAALTDGTIDAASLLSASLMRNQTAIRTGATHRGLSPDLVWLVAELATAPFAYLLQDALLTHRATERADALTAASDAWNEGYCLACGSWPALAESANNHRVLRCSFCSLGWELNRYCCIYCGDSGEAFVTAAPDPERKDRRIELCATCRGYLKTIDLDALSPFPLVAITDMESMDLDVAAMEHGFTRPPLKEFGK